jgi:hypothetical protein
LDKLDQSELQMLLTGSGHGGPHVSLYMPTIKAGQETQQNPIRFKNLIREAENKLAALDLSQSEINELLAQAKELIDDYPFWQHAEDGFALFLAKDFFRHYRLPLVFDELALVSERFHLKPLLRLFSRDQQFYVLALSMNGVRLLSADPHTVTEIELDDTPLSLTDAVGHQLTEQHLQYHSGDAGGDPRYHAQGSGQDDIKPEIRKFFQVLDNGVTDCIGFGDKPLVLAGVEYLLPIYKDITDYKSILEEGVTGNPELLSNEELRDNAWAVAEPFFKKALTETIDRYHSLVNENRASNGLEDIVVAAMDGRIDTLLVARGAHCWGRYDETQRQIQRHNEPTASSEDLLDLAAVQTYTQSGQVFVCDPDVLPDQALAAAIYRY